MSGIAVFLFNFEQVNAGWHLLYSLSYIQNVHSHPGKTRKRGYIYVFAIWITILSLGFIYSRSLNFAQNVICPWLLSISEGSIASPWYSKGWTNIIRRTIVTVSKRYEDNIQFSKKKCKVEPYFCCPSFLCTRVGSCCTRVVSYCTRVVSCGFVF